MAEVLGQRIRTNRHGEETRNIEGEEALVPYKGSVESVSFPNSLMMCAPASPTVAAGLATEHFPVATHAASAGFASAGGTFGLARKTFSGSYFDFSSWSR